MEDITPPKSEPAIARVKTFSVFTIFTRGSMVLVINARIRETDIQANILMLMTIEKLY